MKTGLNKSIICNSLIVLFEIIALFMTINYHGRFPVEYYTEDSNIFAMITSLLYVIYLIRKKDIPMYLKLLKYMSTISLTLTFLVVIFVLAPMYNFNYYGLLFKDSLIFVHLICPLLAIITFKKYDDINGLTYKDNILALTFTIIYAVILVVLNILKVIKGPYPFLYVYEQSLVVSILWLITILTLTYIIGYVLRRKKHER